MEDNLSAVLHGIDDLRLEQRPIPKPGKNEVLIAMNSVGICGSDVHYWKRGAIGDFILRSPMVLGHESSGTIVELGDSVKDLEIGDRVAIEPGVPCRYCEFCKKGKYNLCPEVVFCATPPYHGSLCKYYVHPADFCFKLPDNVSLEEGALLEPLSVAVHSCNRAGIANGDHVLVCGAGPIGLMNLLTAKACGASKVAITDLDESRLKVAKEMGADHVILVESGDGKAVADQATSSGGMVVIVGLGKANVTLPIVNALTREVDIRGIFRYANCYPTALEMISSGKINIKPMITHRFSLKDCLSAFQTSHEGRDGAIKVIIKCSEE
eukprot:gene88-692_t